MKRVLFLSLAFFTVSVFASPFNFPNSCVPVNVNASNNQIILAPGNNEKTAVFLIYNSSTVPFTIDHQKMNVGASAGWASNIDPGHWSALLLTERHFNLSCTQYDNGFTKVLNCVEALKVCQLAPQANANLGTQGSYWLTENQTLQNFYPAIKTRGINIP